MGGLIADCYLFQATFRSTILVICSLWWTFSICGIKLILHSVIPRTYIHVLKNIYKYYIYIL